MSLAIIGSINSRSPGRPSMSSPVPLGEAGGLRLGVGRARSGERRVHALHCRSARSRSAVRNRSGIRNAARHQ
eukprot:4155691-Prymnesium_polylepis.1